MTSVMWFRRDLRLDDNPAWSAAVKEGSVTALFVVDRTLWTAASRRRTDLLGSHLVALDRSLRERGGRLRVEYGAAEVILPKVCGPSGTLYFNRDYTPYAVARDAAVTSTVADVSSHHGGVAHPPGSILNASGDPYRVFTAYWRRWISLETEPASEEASVPSIAADAGAGIPEHEPVKEAGESGAADCVERFLEVADRYDSARDIPAADGTSRLSAHLKFGTIGPRRVIEEVGDATPGRQAFLRQLAWRDFYAQMLYARPDSVDHAYQDQYENIDWRNDPTELAAWKAGTTGFPIVDAGMRQLAGEGVMHNRVRMIAASFLVKDLLVDWRIGERFFRHHLVDADVAQNVGNWQWVAGTGVDAAPYFRVFNPTTQSRRFDPEGDYIRRWVPELAGVRAPAIHQPWESAESNSGLAERLSAVGYPPPIVDHPAARRTAIHAYQAAANS